MNNKTLWIGLGFVIAVFLAGAYLLSGRQSANLPTTTAGPKVAQENNVTLAPSESSPSASPEEGVMTEEVQEVTIKGSEFKYTPATFNLKAGVPVRLTFKNTGATIHNLVVEGLGVSTPNIAPGKEVTVEFTPEAGTYTYFCSVGSHRDLGMQGELTVE